MSDEPDELARLATRYRRFATDEAQGVSPHYERLARDIAEFGRCPRLPERTAAAATPAEPASGGRNPDCRAANRYCDADRPDRKPRRGASRHDAEAHHPDQRARALRRPVAPAGRAAATPCPDRSGRVGRPVPAARPLRLRLGSTLVLRPPVPARLSSVVPRQVPYRCLSRRRASSGAPASISIRSMSPPMRIRPG